MATSYELVGTKTNFSAAVTLSLTGTLDFNKMVFDNMNNGIWTEAQAEMVWNYTDGYKFTITSTHSGTNDTSKHCITKTKAALASGQDASGAVICFDSNRAKLTDMNYYLGPGAKHYDPSVDAMKKWTNLATPLASAKAWALPTNAYKGLLTWSPTVACTTSCAVSWSLYQPKFQHNDYYYNNFRLNAGDTVQAYYKDGAADNMAAGTAIVLTNGATALAALAFGAIVLAF